jgi:hypothetical protein
MLESLEATFEEEKTITILAMDKEVTAFIHALGHPTWRVLTVETMGDAELTLVQANRPHREFCWTCAPVLSAHMVGNADDGDIVVYVDADLFFFCSPQILLDELNAGGTVLIHEHRYSPDRLHYEPSSGRFNVGFVAFRAGEEARSCVERWRQQVLDKCVLDPENGYCGDQGYLNEWPLRYPGLRILQNIGGGVAPWNLLAYGVGGDPSQPAVDGTPVVFFHYHAFRTVSVCGVHVAAIPAWGYDFSKTAKRLLFARYAHRLRSIGYMARKAGFAISSDASDSLVDALRSWIRGRLVLAF